MTRDAAVRELVASFHDPDLLRLIDRKAKAAGDQVAATFAMEHGSVVALALNGLFDQGLIVVEFDGEPIALHAAYDGRFFDPFGLHTSDELLAGWAEFYVAPSANFILRPSNEKDIDAFEIDHLIVERADTLRDALADRCGPAIKALVR